MRNLTLLKRTFKPFRLLPKAFAALALLCTLSLSPHSHASPKIAISVFVEHPALNRNLEGVLAALEAQGYTKESGAEIIIENAQGNMLLLSQISQRLVGLEADVYVAIPTQAAQSLMNALKDSKKPLVFSTVTDPRGARLVQNYDQPEGHVTGVSNATDLKPQFQLFQKLVPGLKRLGVIYNPGEANSVYSLAQMKKVGADMGIEIIPAPATKTSEVSQAAQSLVGQVDAFFVDNDNTALSSFESIVKIGLEHKLPAFVSDTDMVKRGALAALGPNQFQLGQEAGHMAARLLKGEKPSALPVAFPKKLDKVINEKIARKLGLGEHQRTQQNE